MNSEDGELFIKQLATFVRTHEKALANALQFRRQNAPRHGASHSVSSLPTSGLSPTLPERPSTSSSTSSSLAAALSLGTLSLTSHSVKQATLALTAHHLSYLLDQFQDLGIPVGPTGIRIENIHDAAASGNYVSFLEPSQRSKTRGSDVGSIRSVSSMRSVMSSMSSLWASFGIGSGISSSRTEKQKAALQADLKYLYSAFTKIPCLRLSPDFRAHLIRGYEEFPFDRAVPLYVFKNVQALEVCDMDFRQFFGWDRLADQLRSLTLKRACLEDPVEVLIDIVLDDMDKRRRRTFKTQASPTTASGPFSNNSAGAAHTVGMGSSPRRSCPSLSHAELSKSMSVPGSLSLDPRASAPEMPVGSVVSEPTSEQYDGENLSTSVDNGSHDGHRPSLARSNSDEATSKSSTKGSSRPRSHSPRRPSSSRNGTHAYARGSHKVHRSGSGSSQSSLSDSWQHNRRGSTSNLLSMGILPASKWRFLKHLSLANNSLTSIPAFSLSPLSNTLHSLDLSSNLFTQIPDSLATLTALRGLNLSHCMIDSLHSLLHYPLPAITALNLRANRLQSIAGIERLLPLERIDLRENHLTDPMELARLTGTPDIREVWVSGNPFTRTHREYRITIFNLFRRTPGYTEDIIIDATGPTYSERKYLVERAPLPPVQPVIQPPPAPTIPAIDVSKPAIIYDTPRSSSVLWKERPTVRTVSSEGNTHEYRRRKAPKRRIVDLATNDTTARSGGAPLPPLPPAKDLASAIQEAMQLAEPTGQLKPAVPPKSPRGTEIAKRTSAEPTHPAATLTPDSATSSAAEENNYRILAAVHVKSASLPEPTAQPEERSVSQPDDTPHVQRTSVSLNSQLPTTFTTAEEQTHQSPAEDSGTAVQLQRIQAFTETTEQTTPIKSQSTASSIDPCTPTKTPLRSPTRTPSTITTTPPSSVWREQQNWVVSGELYKRKIEALRHQVGDGYLSVLSEEAWDSVRHAPQFHDSPFNNTISPIHASPTHTATHTASIPAIHSGRTLG